MSSNIELYILKPESLKIAIDKLTDFAKKDDITINAFYFLYGYGKLIDNVTNGNELYDYFQKKVNRFSLLWFMYNGRLCWTDKGMLWFIWNWQTIGYINEMEGSRVNIL